MGWVHSGGIVARACEMKLNKYIMQELIKCSNKRVCVCGGKLRVRGGSITVATCDMLVLLTLYACNTK